MKRTFPSSRSDTMVSMVWSASIWARLGDMCTCRRSRWSVPSLCRLRSSPGADVLRAVVVGKGRGGIRRRVEWASTLRRQEVLVPAVPHDTGR